MIEPTVEFTEAGLAIWTFVWDECYWLTASDQVAVERYVLLWQEFHEAESELNTYGRTVDGSNGQPVPSGFISAKVSIDRCSSSARKSSWIDARCA